MVTGGPSNPQELRPLESISDRVHGLNKALDAAVARLAEVNKRMQGDVPTNPNTTGKGNPPAPSGLVSEIIQSLIITDHIANELLEQIARLERI